MRSEIPCSFARRFRKSTRLPRRGSRGSRRTRIWTPGRQALRIAFVHGRCVWGGSARIGRTSGSIWESDSVKWTQRTRGGGGIETVGKKRRLTLTTGIKTAHAWRQQRTLVRANCRPRFYRARSTFFAAWRALADRTRSAGMVLGPFPRPHAIRMVSSGLKLRIIILFFTRIFLSEILAGFFFFLFRNSRSRQHRWLLTTIDRSFNSCWFIRAWYRCCIDSR